MKELWCIIPFYNCWEATRQAALDAIAQKGVKVNLLLVDNGSSPEVGKLAESFAEAVLEAKVLIWHHRPALPSLAESWNLALDFVWAAGGTEAWVLNNDVRVHSHTAAWLRAVLKCGVLFVSAVAVTEEQYHREPPQPAEPHGTVVGDLLAMPGGPDFSCYLISKECHSEYRFDEEFTPCYCEDLDYHRRMMLAGDGRRIFSVNVPYLHTGSGTLKSMPEAERRAKEDAIGRGSRAYYVRKWGGPVNQERFRVPFGNGEIELEDQQPCTTPALQRDTWRR